jgi:hypothetical protein
MPTAAVGTAYADGEAVGTDFLFFLGFYIYIHL